MPNTPAPSAEKTGQILVNATDCKHITFGKRSWRAEWFDDRWLISCGVMNSHGASDEFQALLTLEFDPADLDHVQGNGHVEGRSHRPSSPVLQECYAHQRPNVAQLLMVGQHGPRHFSAVASVSANAYRLEIAEKIPTDLAPAPSRWHMSAEFVEQTEFVPTPAWRYPLSLPVVGCGPFECLSHTCDRCAPTVSEKKDDHFCLTIAGPPATVEPASKPSSTRTACHGWRLAGIS